MMKRRTGQAGFSLMEVLFAVVVLMLGLVFVASQFPLGMIQSRNMADETMGPLTADNAWTNMQLQMEYFLHHPAYTTPGYPSYALEHRDDDPGPMIRGYVHPLVKPNVRDDSIAGLVVVIDDPESIVKCTNPSLPGFVVTAPISSALSALRASPSAIFAIWLTASS